MALKLASSNGAGLPQEVTKGFERHLGAVYLHNIKPVRFEEILPPLSAAVLSLDGDLQKHLHRHKRTGVLAHFPAHWGGSLSNLIADTRSFERWVGEDWQRMPLAPVDRIIEQFEEFCCRLRACHPGVRIYVVNANQVTPQALEFDPILHDHPVEERCRAFNGALREFCAHSDVRVLDFGLYARRFGLEQSKDIRHVRNGVYTCLGRALAHDLATLLRNEVRNAG